MSWVRSNIRLGAWCALFALAVQFGVLMGHFHPINLASYPDAPAAIGATNSVALHIAAPAEPAPLVEYCALCAVINLAGTALPAAQPAAITAPVVYLLRYRIDLGAFIPLSPLRIFRARAPPFA